MAARPGGRLGRQPGRSSRARAGDRVTHDTFGLGTVVSTAGVGEKARGDRSTSAATGVKRLLLRYAPVEKL